MNVTVAANRHTGHCSDIERPFRYDLHRNFGASLATRSTCIILDLFNRVSIHVILSRQKLRIVLLASFGALYLWFSYLVSVSNKPSLALVLIGIAPVVGGGIIAVWKSNTKFIALGTCGALLVALYFFSEFLRDHIAWFYFLQHAGTMVFLGVLFGSTLKTRENALCSRIARLLDKTVLDAAYLTYTWKVTAAWTIYFFASAIISFALFFLASIEVWSLFASVLTPISIGAMFAIEYFIRVRALPGRKHFSISQTIQAYRNYPRG